MDGERDTAGLPIAEEIVLRRIGQMEGVAAPRALTEADSLRLRALVVGRVVSTGDPVEDYEIIEIVPPDEPALVDDTTIVAFT
jgi:hypothetical protein